MLSRGWTTDVSIYNRLQEKIDSVRKQWVSRTLLLHALMAQSNSILLNSSFNSILLNPSLTPLCALGTVGMA